MNNKLQEQQIKEHIKKYRALNEKYGVAWTGSAMPDGWTEETLKAKVLESPENENLNFIPLEFWDILAVSMLAVQRIPGLSLSQAVCMQKQACLDYLFKEDENADSD